MLTIPAHKGNANQNHTKIPPYLLEWLSSRTPPPTNAGKDAGWEGGGGGGSGKEPSYTAGRNVS
jgi:hypothetical protein